MYQNPIFWLNVIESGLFIGAAFYWLGKTLLERAFSLRVCLGTCVFYTALLFVRYSVPNDASPLWAHYVMILGSLALLCYFGFGVRGMKIVLTMIQYLVGMFVMELFISLEVMLMPLSLQDTLHNFMLPLNCLVVNVITVVDMALVCALITLIRRMRRRGAHGVRLWPVYLRVCVLIGFSMGMVVLLLTLGLDRRFAQRTRDYVWVLVCVIPLLLVSASYFVRDLKYIAQVQRNETLEHQKQISDALLGNLRFFRHNLINLLYGFEGAILSGDIGEMQAYYRDMTQRCAMVNNENVVALEKIDCLPLGALILHGIDCAQAQNIPFYLYVQDETRLKKRLKESDFAQIAGVLIDNAIEASARASFKYVSVEIREVDAALEFLVRNTYPEDLDPKALLTGTSRKPGDHGNGLASCREILSRYPCAFLNLSVDPQYVSAQLLVEK